MSLFGWDLKSGNEFYYLIWLVVLLAILSIRNLLDSLYHGFPVGYLITWRNPNVKLKDGTTSSGKRILIDGQQRVTALMAALLGREVATAAQQQRESRAIGMKSIVIVADFRVLLSLLDILMETERRLEMINPDVYFRRKHLKHTQQSPRNVSRRKQADPSR